MNLSVSLLQLTDGQIVDSSFDLSVLDSNSLRFLFKHAPEVARELQIGSDFSFDTSNPSHRESWMVYDLPVATFKAILCK